jgi:stage V sporulation protein B
MMVPLAGVLIALAGPILTLWVGPAYAEYAPIVIILTLANFIEMSQWPGMAILQGMARHRRLATAWVGAALANLALSLALIHVYGAIGVALGTLIPTTAVCAGFVLPHAMRTIGVGARDVLKEVFLPALVPAIPMMAVLYASQWLTEARSLLSLLCTVSIAGLVYVAGYLGLARDLERQLVHGFARRALRIAFMRPTHS